MEKYILPLLLLHSTAFHKGSTREVISREALPVFLAVSNYLAVGYMSLVKGKMLKVHLKHSGNNMGSLVRIYS